MAGLHGVLAVAAARRRREAGMRMALGAAEGSVIRLAMREILAAILLGVAPE